MHALKAGLNDAREGQSAVPPVVFAVAPVVVSPVSPVVSPVVEPVVEPVVVDPGGFEAPPGTWRPFDPMRSIWGETRSLRVRPVFPSKAIDSPEFA